MAPADLGIGRDVARRALRIVGTITPLRTAPHVVELAPLDGARGPGTTWDLRGALARHWPRTTGWRATEPPGDPAGTADVPDDRPLVIGVRDAHRHGWVRATLDAMLGRRPDATVVEMGLPQGEAPVCAAYLTTYDAGAAGSMAVADALTPPSFPVSGRP
jgi:beta-N-acetylhexosaminidase